MENSNSSLRNWSMWAHLSSLSMFIFPLGNVIGPLIVYLLQKDNSVEVRAHSRKALNLQLTFILVFLLSLGGMIGATIYTAKAEAKKYTLLADEIDRVRASESDPVLALEKFNSKHKSIQAAHASDVNKILLLTVFSWIGIALIVLANLVLIIVNGVRAYNGKGVLAVPAIPFVKN